MRGEKLLLVLYLCQKFKETAAVVVGFAVRKVQVGMLRMYVEVEVGAFHLSLSAISGSLPSPSLRNRVYVVGNGGSVSEILKYLAGECSTVSVVWNQTYTQ